MGGKKRDRQVFEALTMILQFGICMIVPICLCMAVGIWIGKRTGETWVTVPLFFIGALAGFTSVYKMAKRLIHQDNKERPWQQGGAPSQEKAASQTAKDLDHVKKNE